MDKNKKHILFYKEINMNDVPLVGGKNASLGEMISSLSKEGVNVPNGFATTSAAFWYFMEKTGLKKKIEETLKNLDVNDIKNLQNKGKEVRNLFLKAKIPADLEKEILESYHKLSREYGENSTDVAVRTSATSEDNPEASFAGQYWTYLNVKGDKDLLKAIRGCLSSLFTDRAIFYRAQNGFSQLQIALSIGIQKMARSDLGSAGVMFSLDTESGFKDVVLINGSYGLGEMIVQGEVTTDEFYVFKPTLKQGYKSIISKTLGRKDQKFVYKKNGGIKKEKVSLKEQNKFCLNDDEILTLAKWASIIEEHYSKERGKWTPMDMEWAKDGKTNELFIVQARPETVHSREKGRIYQEYEIENSPKIKPILKGIAVGEKIAQGKVHKILDVSKLKEFKKGEILVTKMTDPDWVPIMKIASAIVTDEGSRACHAAIVSRELGIPCVVGTFKATEVLKDGEEITIDCSQGLDGRVFKGKIPFKVKEYDLTKIKKPKVKIEVNIGAPEIAFKTSFLPVEGVGLAREEFIIAQKVRVHPLALYYYEELKTGRIKDIPLENKIEKREIKKIISQINKITIEHKDKKEHFIKELAEGIAIIGSAFYPKEVIVRFSDFKTNEYAQLIGGELFEPKEDNPMLGWRGASRYYDSRFKPAFLMEVKAIQRARDIFGLKNISVMVPFCRTVKEGEEVLSILKENKFISDVKADKRKENEPNVYVMCEIPANVILADEFLDFFDGFSVGSNDLTQLTVGIDRDNAGLQKITDERNEAVKESIKKAVQVCRKRKKYSGICGDAPSSLPDFADFLMKTGIQSISLSPDAVMKTILYLNKKTKN